MIFSNIFVKFVIFLGREHCSELLEFMAIGENARQMVEWKLERWGENDRGEYTLNNLKGIKIIFRQNIIKQNLSAKYA